MNRFTLTDTTQRAFLLLIACCLLVFGAMTAAPASGAPKAADLVSDGQPIDLEDEKYRKLFQELRSDHNFTDTEIEAIFAGQTINKRVLELMDKQWEAKPYYKYAPLFITPQIIATGRQKLAEHRDVLDRIEEEIGVDREIVVAIWGIETRYGTNQGSFNVLQTLNTLFAAYPRRSTFFRNELVHFLLLCR
ncbi:MAG: lytic murein transglycosylase, partial [Desulfobulbaceae bacterium]